MTKPRTRAAQAILGVVCVLVGIGLYIAYAGVALNYYDEQASPWWLTSLSVLAVVLALAGLGVLVLAAVRGARGARPASPD